VTLVSVTQPMDDSPTGRFLGTVLAAQGQLDNDTRREKTVAGMREAIKRGIWPCRISNQHSQPDVGSRKALGRRGMRLPRTSGRASSGSHFPPDWTMNRKRDFKPQLNHSIRVT
jgi:DNA invertase Pin-like site-specific DNA recombinase